MMCLQYLVIVQSRKILSIPSFYKIIKNKHIQPLPIIRLVLSPKYARSGVKSVTLRHGVWPSRFSSFKFLSQ